MHRCYQPILPSHNRLLQKRWDNTYYEEHMKKVQEARPIVDTRPPQTYMHLHLKPKKLQLEEERLATVERDNRILLEKMSNIMRTQGRIDHRNNYEYKSLNREKRVRELLRVTRENQEILQRITNKQPQYDHQKWASDWEDNQRFMDQIALYPRDWWKKEGREKSTVSESGSKSSRRQKNGKKGEKKDKKESQGQGKGKSSRRESRSSSAQPSEREQERN